MSCASASACIAVGSYSNGTTGVTLAERWNGTTWSIEHTPNPTGASGSGLSGVSCASASACTAVGSYDGGTLAERWNGTKWTSEHTPNPAPASPTGASENLLDGVWCASASPCTAVGYYSTGSTEVTLAARWNGTTWSPELPPNPTGASDSVLSSLSCALASACTAVGSYFNGTTGVTLAERWNGGG